MVACGSPGSGTTTTTDSEPRGQTLGSSQTNVAETVSSMNAGDVYYVDFDSDGSATIDFNGGSSSAQYKLIIQSTESLNSTVAIAGSDISANVVESFDDLLRKKEAELKDEELAVTEPKFSITKAVGDSRTFHVLSSISSVTQADTVSATQKCTKDHVIVYVDNDVPSTDLSSQNIETLCNQFEYAVAYDELLFGEPSDVNSDGHVVVLITLGVNRLGASGGGIVTGYFYAGDLYRNVSAQGISNEMEILYILAPDSDGDESSEPISTSFAMDNLMPAVVPHEFQHAVSYNQHVLVNRGSAESNWMNEGLSHLAEDIVGYGQENPSRVSDFLEYPESVSLVASGSPDLAERGAEYLFLRYLYERASSPTAFLLALEDTNKTGEENLVQAFAGTDSDFNSWTTFMRRWGIAVALTNTGISSTEEFQYNDRVMNSTTSYWQGVCLICDPEDGRDDTLLTGPYSPDLTTGSLNLSLTGTATAFYNIPTPPRRLSLTGNANAGLQGVLIRIE